MKKVVSAMQMKALDENTIHNMEMPSLILMERAALETVRYMEEHFRKTGQKEREKILVLCGSGNNGGDGVAIARILHLHGYSVVYTLIGNAEHFTAELKTQIKIAEKYGVRKTNIPEFHSYTTIVDAVFGVGLSREIKGTYQVLLEHLEQADAWKVAVDLPSGVDGTYGIILGSSYHADLTVTYAYRKSGLCLYPGRAYTGKIVVADVGIYDDENQINAFYLEDSDLSMIPDRQADGNKGTFGKVLIVAGSEGMAGAAFFSAKAALKSGAGMVRIHTVKENRVALQTLLPEAIYSDGEMESDYMNAISWCDTIVLGPGLGTSVKAALKAGWFLAQAALHGKSVVLDADGLNLLSVNPGWKEYLSDKCILTPHIVEMSRLTGKSVSDIKKNPVKIASDYARETGAICVLKDACTVVASPDGEVYYNLSGNASMAIAGSGDVLSGILGALHGLFEKQQKKINAIQIAALGVYLHGRAGDMAAEKNGMYGLLAGNLADFIPEVRKLTDERKK